MSRLDRILGGGVVVFGLGLEGGFGFDLDPDWFGLPCIFEAFASSPWFNYLASKVPAGKKALITNIDETAVCLFQGARRGAMLQHPGDNCRAAAWLMQRERT